MKCPIVEFHRGLCCLLRQKQISEEEIQLYLEIVTCDPSISTMDHPKLVLSNQMEESISAYRIKQVLYRQLQGPLLKVATSSCGSVRAEKALERIENAKTQVLFNA